MKDSKDKVRHHSILEYPLEAITFLTAEAKDLIRSKLQSVIDGEYILYNTVSKEYPLVNDERIDDMVELFIELHKGHGIKHLQFIKLDTMQEDEKLVYEEDFGETRNAQHFSDKEEQFNKE